MTHPSFFALDAHLLDPHAGEVKSHLETCPACRAHVAALKVATPFPSKLEGLQSPAAPAWWRFLALGFAAAALLITLGSFATRETPQLITAKGAPAAALWINRDGKVTIWNGERLRAGDAVRVELAPAGFTHVTVFDEHTRQVLYEARVPESSTALTPAWKFDGQSPSESLRVVLSLGSVPAELLQGEKCATDPESYCVRFTLLLTPSP